MSTVKLKKNDVVEAEIFLNCGEEGKGHRCARLRNELLDVPEVNFAETVETLGSDTNFCVTGTAILKKDKADDFKQYMDKFTEKVKEKGITIRDSKILLQKHN